MKKVRLVTTLVVLALAAVFGMAPGRCGMAAEGFFSDLPAPDVRGTWEVTYDDQVDVEIDLGGALYVGTITGASGSVGFTHDGTPLALDLDCDDPLVTCPSELFPAEVLLEQRRFQDAPHQVHMVVSDQECDGVMRLPDPNLGECGGETGVDCTDEICDGDVIEVDKVALGSISNPVPPQPLLGSTPYYAIGIALSGGIAIPTANCILVGGSFADADIEYDGTYDPEEPTMDAHTLASGVITVIYRGGCFWGAADAQVAGVALLGAEIRLTTGFTASKATGPLGL